MQFYLPPFFGKDKKRDKNNQKENWMLTWKWIDSFFFYSFFTKAKLLDFKVLFAWVMTE